MYIGTRRASHNLKGCSEWASSKKSYDYRQNLTSLANITALYSSDKWTEETGPILTDLWLGVDNAIFEYFGIDTPEPAKQKDGIETAARLAASINVFEAVFAYFYIAAGAFLLILGVLYWFGKTEKSIGEWLSILVRSVFGICITMFCLFSFTDDAAGDGFTSSFWPVPVVAIAYFIGMSTHTTFPMVLTDMVAVIVLDNLLVWHTNKTIAHRTEPIRADSETRRPSEPRHAKGNAANAVK